MQFESHNFKTVHFLHWLFAILFSATYFPDFYGQKRMGGGGEILKPEQTEVRASNF